MTIECVEDPGPQVLALPTMQASGRSSGAPVAIRRAHVARSRAGDQQLLSHASWEDGLEAVGLEG